MLAASTANHASRAWSKADCSCTSRFPRRADHNDAELLLTLAACGLLSSRSAPGRRESPTAPLREQADEVVPLHQLMNFQTPNPKARARLPDKARLFFCLFVRPRTANRDDLTALCFKTQSFGIPPSPAVSIFALPARITFASPMKRPAPTACSKSTITPMYGGCVGERSQGPASGSRRAPG